MNTTGQGGTPSNNTLPNALEFNSGWVKDANGVVHYFEVAVDESTGVKTVVYTDAPGGTVTTPTGAVTLHDPAADVANTEYYVEVVRLDGGSANPTAVAEVPVHANNATQVDLVEGVAYSVTGKRHGLTWRFLRETAQDSTFNVNSATYAAGTGPVYGEIGYEERDVAHSHTVDFSADANCFVEIRITREV